MAKQIDYVAAFQRAYDRLMAMTKSDPQMAKLIPLDSVTKAIQAPGLSYQEIIARTLAGYADRDAMGSRAYDIRADGATGRRTRHYLPAFDTITYAELASRIEAIASAWRHHPRHRVNAGEFVSLIAFTGAQMAVVDLACVYAQAISCPIQANLPAPDALTILNDIEPVSLVASIDNLDIAVTYAMEQTTIRGIIVIDSDARDDDDKDRIAAAKTRLAEAGDKIAFDTYEDIIAFGRQHTFTPLPKSPKGADAMSMVMYTSGSTGTPKGAIVHEAMCNQFWTELQRYQPTVQLAYAPMNHFMGRNMVVSTLAQGGTVHFTLKSDMSTLFDDIRIARPTFILFIPRMSELIYQHYQSEVQKRIASGEDAEAADRAVRAEMSKTYLGDRVVCGGTGSSPTAPEVLDFIRECFDLAFVEGYGQTEAGGGAMTSANRVLRTVVNDYKLKDVPELGYYTTDKPYPRGELLVKSRLVFQGYFKKPDVTAALFDPDGYLMTGDIMEERGPDHLVWLDRRNNVIKLSQAEFVAVGPLEATYLANSPLIKQVFIYGSSYRSFLLAVVVPDMDVARARIGHEPDMGELRTLVLGEFQQAARTASLKSFEVPRDVLIELEPFSLENGLLSSVRKPLRPNLKRRYADALEAMYQDMDRKQQEELAQLRSAGAGLSTLERVAGAFKANLGLASVDPDSAQSYADMGGDSLGAVGLGLLLEEMFGVQVPVSVILHPAGSAQRLAQFIETAQAGGGDGKITFAAVHGSDATVIHASDLKLDRFFDPESMERAARAAAPATTTRTVLLTGSNGFLGRFLCLEWLEAMAAVGGKVICMIRGADAASARRRLDDAIGTADPALTARFRQLAEKHLEMVAGDLAEPRLGLSEAEFERLANEVDQIVHPAALVNHMLSYQNLFEPNVAGTAELIRLALTGRRKRFDYVSSLAVPSLHPSPADIGEDMDVRTGVSTVPLRDIYAMGYGASKWAGEVLLREAHEQFGLPVNVYRGDMMLAHSHFKGQYNAPDMFTRMLYSVVMTGLAPESFYELDASGKRPKAHYDGLPVDFLAASMQQIGAQVQDGYRTFHTSNMHHDDGISLDTITDWIESAGYAVKRIPDHADWLARFEGKLRNLSEEQRQMSSLPIIGYFAQPHEAHPAPMPADNYVAAVKTLPAGPDVPHITEAFIHKYLADMRLLGMIPEPSRLVA